MAANMWIAILFSISVLVPIVVDGAADPIVKLKLGTIRGSILTSDEGTPINAFRGIPYAKPPLKQLRFKRPVAVEPWSGILDATEDGATCIQFDALSQRFTGDEDCLFINVYVPEIGEEKKKKLGPLPVMMFIHGGGFVWGSADSNLYGPQRLVDRDVILVTINYRIAALGYMSTGDDSAPGNYGFYDQILALKWIQENIGSFGGDPTRVTLFGESAGSMAVLLHVLSPLSAGLFHAAIGQSGSPFCGFGVTEEPLKFSRDLAKALGCPTDSTEKMVACIRRKPALDIVVHSSKIEGDNFMNFESENPLELLYGAVPEVAGKDGQPFLTEDYFEQLKGGNFNKVPVILGITQDEGLMIYCMLSTLLKKQGREQMKDVLLPFLQSVYPQPSKEQQKLLREKAYNNYFANKMDEDVTTKQLVKFYGDIMFNYCTDLTVQKLAEGGVPVYPYKFTYARPEIINVLRPSEKFLENGTVNHADDLPYLFRCGYFAGTQTLKDGDLRVSDLFVTLWTNFAKNGVPSLDGARFDHSSFEWETYAAQKPRFLNLGLNPAMEDGHLCQKTPFWTKIGQTSPMRGHKDEL